MKNNRKRGENRGKSAVEGKTEERKEKKATNWVMWGLNRDKVGVVR